MVILKPYIKKKKKAVKIENYVTNPFKGFATLSEIRGMINNYGDFELDLSSVENLKKHGASLQIKIAAKNFSVFNYLLRIILDAEKHSHYCDVIFLNRIIKNGGFVECIKKLESGHVLN